MQRGETDLLLFNPNSEETPLDKEKPLRLWLSPDTDRARLLAIKGMVEKHYTAERLNLYLDGSEIRLKNKSPLARALIKAREGDTVWLDTPVGREQIEILSVEYVRID